MKRTLLLRALGAALLTSVVVAGTAQAAPTWLDEFAPYGDTRTIQTAADAAMAPDGTVIFARMTPTSAIEVRERPSGGQLGPTITLGPVGTIFQPFPNVQILTAKDGTAALLFDLGSIRYVSVRPPGGTWGRPEEFMPSRASRGAAALAPDGVLWGVGRTPGTSDALSLFQFPRKPPIPLPKPRQGAIDTFAVLTAPRPGVVRVAYAEQLAGTNPAGDCFVLGAVHAVDVTAEKGVGSTRSLDEFSLRGKQGEFGCDVNSGEGLFPPVHLTTDEAGADTAVYSVITFPDSKLRTQARHRPPGGDWPNLKRDPEVVSADGVFEGGAGTVAIVEANQIRSLAARRPDGRWTPIQLSSGNIGEVRAASTGAATTVVAWSEGETARARVISADLVPGPPVTLAEQGASLAGLGGDAEGNAVALYNVRQPDQSLRLFARGFDTAPPRLTAFEAPAAGRVNRPLAFSVAGSDVWAGAATNATWDFGDGRQAAGLRVEHTFARAGVFTVRASVQDAVGNAASRTSRVAVEATTTTPPDRRPSVVTRLRAVPAHPRSHDPVTIAFTSDESGRAHVALAKVCRKACAHHGVTVAVGTGPARIHVGRLSAGSWRVTVGVTDDAGNASRPQSMTLRVKR